MKIFTLMEKPVLTIDEDSIAQKAVEKMVKEAVGSLLVKRGDEAVGIISSRDILSKVITDKRDPEKVKVKEIMVKPLITVDKNTDGEKVIEIMAKKGISRIFVTEEDNIVGVFSTSDITKMVKNN